MFGVGIFICTQAQTQGFAQFFIDSTIGSNGALTLRSRFQPRYEGLVVPTKNANAARSRRNYFEGIHNASEIMRVSRQFSNVVSCSPVLRGNLSARAGFENATRSSFSGSTRPRICARLISPNKLSTAGSMIFVTTPARVIIGYRLADTARGRMRRLDSTALARRRILAFHRRGHRPQRCRRDRLHSRLCAARVAQRLLKKPYEASMIIYKLRDPDRAPAAGESLRDLVSARFAKAGRSARNRLCNCSSCSVYRPQLRFR